jgi:acyl-CoA thioester hydrolase
METRPRATIDFRVRYAETDQMGVVYHANYLVWCEIGRTELMRVQGRTYADLERDGVLLAVSDATLRFHAPAHYDDLVRVEAWVEDVRSRSVAFGYLISLLQDDEPVRRLVSARTALVALDRHTRPRKLPDNLIASLRHG